jgi:hypothetical protein
MKRTILPALALLAAAAAPAWAQTQGPGLTEDPNLPIVRAGQRGAAFLDIGVGARAQSLGGAFVAGATDVSALYWNTAGIARVDGFSAHFSQASLYGDLGIDHSFIGVVLPLGLHHLGLSLNYLSSGDMPWTSEEYPNSGFGGDFDPIRGDFSWTATAVGLHYGRLITDRLAAGVALKMVSEGIPGASAEFLGFDVGTQFETGLFGVTIGAALRNVGTEGRVTGRELNRRVNTAGSRTQLIPANRIIEIESVARSHALPTAFQFSVMSELLGRPQAVLGPSPTHGLRVMMDLSEASNTDLQTAFGVEYSFHDLAFVRAGKRWLNEAQISHDLLRNASIGGGIQLPVGGLGRVALDYAFTAMGDLSNVQLFTIEVRF